MTRPTDGTDASNDVGADAKPRGVAVTELLASPAPTLVTARTRNSYVVPFDKRVPSSIWVTNADVEDENVLTIASFHVLPTRTCTL